MPWENQILICEMVKDTIYICEPLVHPANEFGKWDALKYGQSVFHVFDRDYLFVKKFWYPFPVNGDWQSYADSGEGIVLKNRNSVLGYHNMRYGKLESYYLKLPDRVSYEDLIEFRNGQFIGYHGVYTDPDNCYSSHGVYEVFLRKRVLVRFRSRKKFGDPHWYVVSLNHPPKFFGDIKLKVCGSTVFKYDVSECDYFPSDGGTIRMRTVCKEQIPGKVEYLQCPDVIKLCSNFEKMRIGQIFNYGKRKYKIVEIFPTHAVAAVPRLAKNWRESRIVRF